MSGLLTLATLSAMGAVVYHHVGYPLLLGRLSRGVPGAREQAPRGYRRGAADAALPHVTLIMPAYNEAKYIAEKLRNLAALDYPEEKFTVWLACDGCRDRTVAIARAVSEEPACRHLSLRIFDFAHNRGKVAILNALVPQAEGELVALSDVSALLSVDALWQAAHHLAASGAAACDAGRDPVGLLTGHYRLLRPGSEGEARYWRYQGTIKAREAALHSTLGSHGAFYLFRRELFSPLEADTINDDFVLPMRMVAKGYRADYHASITALELEQSDEGLEQRRRRRIAAGNLQQLLRLSALLLPRHGYLAFTFASGKALRVLMPWLMLLALCGSLLLSTESHLFLAAASAQTLLYLLALAGPALLSSPPDWMRALNYLVEGHLAGLVGSARYLLKRDRGSWR